MIRRFLSVVENSERMVLSAVRRRRAAAVAAMTQSIYRGISHGILAKPTRGYAPEFVQRLAGARPRKPSDPARLTAAELRTRGHWRDMTLDAPEYSAGWLIGKIAGQLYSWVGEIGGDGVGATFEANAELLYRQNFTDETMALAAVEWAKYETEALAANDEMNRIGKWITSTLTEYQRADLLWTIWGGIRATEGVTLPESPYELLGRVAPSAAAVPQRRP